VISGRRRMLINNPPLQADRSQVRKPLDFVNRMDRRLRQISYSGENTRTFCGVTCTSSPHSNCSSRNCSKGKSRVHESWGKALALDEAERFEFLTESENVVLASDVDRAFRDRWRCQAVFFTEIIGNQAERRARLNDHCFPFFTG